MNLFLPILLFIILFALFAGFILFCLWVLGRREVNA